MEPQSYFSAVTSNPGMFPGSGPIGPFNMMNMQGIPGMSGAPGMFASMIMSPLMSWMGGDRFMPAQFAPTINLYDQYRKQRDYRNVQSTIKQVTELDQANYARMLRGMVGTAGVPLSAQRERAIQTISGDFAAISPTLGPMFPEIYDQLHGARGSGILFGQRMFQGGRYAFDPATGLPGLTATSAARMTNQIYDRLYGEGADLTAMKGLGAGRAGALYDELQRRGLGAAGITPTDRQNVYARGISESGGQGMESMLNALSRMPEMSDKLRDMQSGRITQKLKEMAGAVAAMKDIFGENGNPNAPISQIIEGLQAISQGGLNQIGGSRVEQMVRETSNVARRSGMGMDNMMQLMASSTQVTDSMGLNRLFANNVALSGAAFGASYGANVGGTPAWGRQDKAAMTALDSRLTAGAASSSVANNLATMIRLQEEVGFDPNSEAYAMVQSLRNNPNNLTYEFNGQTRQIYRPTGELQDLAVASMEKQGLSRGDALSAFSNTRRQTAWNQKPILDYNLDATARRLQGPIDAAEVVRGSFYRSFRAAGMTRQEAEFNANKVATNAFKVNAAQASDPEAILAAAGLSTTDPRMRRAAIGGIAEMDQRIKTDPAFAQFPGVDPYLQSFNEQNLAGNAVIRDSARTEAQLQSALSGLGRGSPIERLVDAVMENTNGELSFRDFAVKALGGVPSEDVLKALEGPSKSLVEEIQRYNSAPTEQVRRDALAKIQDMTKDLRKKAETMGIGEMGAVTPKQTKSALQAMEGNTAGALDYAEQLEIMLGSDKNSYQMLGADANQILRDLGKNNRELRGLADKYGTSLGGLFATDADRNAAFTLLQEEGGARRDMGALQAIRAGLQSGKKLDVILAEMEKTPELKDLVTSVRTQMAGKSDKEINAVLGGMIDQGEAKYNAIQKNKQEMADKYGTPVESLANSQSATPEDAARAEVLRREQIERMRGIHKQISTGINPYQRDVKGAETALAMARMTGNPALIAAAEARLKGANAALGQAKASFDERAKMYSMSPEAAYSQLAKGLGSKLSLDDQDKLKEEVLKSGVLESHALRDSLPALKTLREQADKKGVSLKEHIESIRKGGSREDKELVGQISGLEDLIDFNASTTDYLQGLKKAAGPGQSGEGTKKPEITMTGNLTVDIVTGQGGLTATGTTRGMGDQVTT